MWIVHDAEEAKIRLASITQAGFEDNEVMKTATPNPKVKDGRADYRILKICVKYPQPSRLLRQFGASVPPLGVSST
jgi:hypothetical protein